MANDAPQTERLWKLLELARIYRGWTRNELARALGRDPTKLFRGSGNPKLDFLLALADVIEWSVDEVVEYLRGGETDSAGRKAPVTFDQANQAALEAHAKGEYRRMIELSRQMYEVAQTPEERARACNRESGGWDGLGRYTKSLEAIRRGLRHNPLTLGTRLVLQSNLANAYYTLWDLTSARGTSQVLLDWSAESPPTEFRERATHAFAFYVRGNTDRRAMFAEPENRAAHAESAHKFLRRAEQMHRDLAAEFSRDALAGIANTCRGGLIEVEVELGQRSPEAGVEAVLDGLNPVIDTDAATNSDWLESYGWWCIFGANIALRHLAGRELQRKMAIFTNKALEIADRLDNWALRERVFTMQYSLHQALSDTSGLELDYVIDEEDMRLITGTMGRFPSFRRVGWQIFETAKVLKNSNWN